MQIGPSWIFQVSRLGISRTYNQRVLNHPPTGFAFSSCNCVQYTSSLHRQLVQKLYIKNADSIDLCILLSFQNISDVIRNRVVLYSGSLGSWRILIRFNRDLILKCFSGDRKLTFDELKNYFIRHGVLLRRDDHDDKDSPDLLFPMFDIPSPKTCWAFMVGLGVWASSKSLCRRLSAFECGKIWAQLFFDLKVTRYQGIIWCEIGNLMFNISKSEGLAQLACLLQHWNQDAKREGHPWLVLHDCWGSISPTYRSLAKCYSYRALTFCYFLYSGLLQGFAPTWS